MGPLFWAQNFVFWPKNPIFAIRPEFCRAVAVLDCEVVFAFDVIEFQRHNQPCFHFYDVGLVQIIGISIGVIWRADNTFGKD